MGRQDDPGEAIMTPAGYRRARGLAVAVLELFEAYKRAFEKVQPGARVVVKQQQTNAAFKGKAEVKSRLETEWDTYAKANYAKARELTESAPGRVK